MESIIIFGVSQQGKPAGRSSFWALPNCASMRSSAGASRSTPERHRRAGLGANLSALTQLRASRRVIKKQPLSNTMTNNPTAAPITASRRGQFTHSDMVRRALIARRYRQQTHFASPALLGTDAPCAKSKTSLGQSRMSADIDIIRELGKRSKQSALVSFLGLGILFGSLVYSGWHLRATESQVQALKLQADTLSRENVAEASRNRTLQAQASELENRINALTTEYKTLKTNVDRLNVVTRTDNSSSSVTLE